VFEDCLFVCRAAGTDTEIIDFSCAAGTAGRVTAYFLNCQFVNPWQTQISEAVVIPTLTEPASAYLFFDSRCSFAGVTDIVVTGKNEIIWFGHASQQFDHNTQASPDWLNLGLAGHPET